MVYPQVSGGFPTRNGKFIHKPIFKPHSEASSAMPDLPTGAADLSVSLRDATRWPSTLGLHPKHGEIRGAWVWLGWLIGWIRLVSDSAWVVG